MWAVLWKVYLFLLTLALLGVDEAFLVTRAGIKQTILLTLLGLQACTTMSCS